MHDTCLQFLAKDREMSEFGMQQTLTDLRTKYDGRAAQVDMIPDIADRQRFMFEELTAIGTEKAEATKVREINGRIGEVMRWLNREA